MTKQEFNDYIKNNTFNVYNLEYPQEFINKLPVVFDYWKNKDLSDIPEIYHILFLTDWNWGPYSKMDMEDRSYMNGLFLQYNKWDVKRRIELKKQAQTV
jgi:hypothetical protein